MKKPVIYLIGAMMISTVSSVWAGEDDQAILQQAATNIVTISQAVKLTDETGVTLTGQLTKHLKGDHYELKDSTGAVSVEIDDDVWRQAGLKVGDHVRLMGEVDRHRYKATDIEVVKIEKHAH